MNKLALFASGSGSNVENIWKYFKNSNETEVTIVFCNNPNAFVIERCKKMGVPCEVFSRDSFYNSTHILEVLNGLNINLIVLAGFLWLIPEYLIKAFPGQIVNIHPALLPKYGGKGMYGDKVHKAVVENNEVETGITVHLVNEHFDEGEIVFQAKCKVDPDDSFSDVAEKVHRLEYAFFPKIIDNLLNKIELKP